MDNKKAQELINKYQQGTITPQEQDILDGWYLKLAAEQQVNITESQLIQKKQAIWTNLQVNQKIARIIKIRFRLRIAAAAAIVLAICGSVFYFNHKPIPVQAANNITKNDIAPGGNKAYLTLANGKTISLTNAASGQIAKQAGISITKTKSGQLVYTVMKTDLPLNGIAESNTITTPKGGQWQVDLPDGTKVWLNAASSLTYPVSFTALKTRRVELEGEAYFEVAKDKAHPFIVHTGKQDVQVLGTHFNINAYKDESSVKTTLLEGSVHVVAINPTVKNGITAYAKEILKPGQQSTLSNGNIKVNFVDTQAAIAWKNAIFFFDNDDLENIMKRVDRWYNVQVVFQNPGAKRELFSGRISRSENVSEVLKMLALTGAAKFKIEGREIIVIK